MSSSLHALAPCMSDFYSNYFLFPWPLMRSRKVLIQIQITMGNSSERQSVIEEGGKVKWNNSKFNNITLKDHALEGEISVHNKKDFDTWKENQVKNPGSTSHFSFNPIKSSYEESGMCGSGGTAKVAFEEYPYRLSEEIKSRKEGEDEPPFDESELWYLLYAISAVGRKFHESGYKIGDVCPENIVSNENGDIQVVNQFSWPDFQTNYQKALYEKEISYLSPEELEEVEIGRSYPEADFELSESFSTGLTLLDTALKTDSHKFYDKKLNFDFEALHGDQVNILNEPAFSNQIKHTILNLTDRRPGNRMKLTEVHEWLEPYENRIVNFESFSIPSSPRKLYQTEVENPIKERVLNFNEEHHLRQSSGTAIVDLVENKPNRFSQDDRIKHAASQQFYLHQSNNTQNLESRPEGQSRQPAFLNQSQDFRASQELKPIQIRDSNSVQVLESKPLQVLESRPVQVLESATIQSRESRPIQVLESRPQVLESRPQVIESRPVFIQDQQLQRASSGNLSFPEPNQKVEIQPYRETFNSVASQPTELNRDLRNLSNGPDRNTLHPNQQMRFISPQRPVEQMRVIQQQPDQMRMINSQQVGPMRTNQLAVDPNQNIHAMRSYQQPQQAVNMQTIVRNENRSPRHSIPIQQAVIQQVQVPQTRVSYPVNLNPEANMANMSQQIKSSQFRTTTQNLSPSKDEEMLRKIEEKIKFSRQNFPSE